MVSLSPTEVRQRNLRQLQVGHICLQWAQLEWLVAIAIWKLLRVDGETGRILTGGLDILPRINMAMALATHLKAPKRIRNSLKKVRSALQGGLSEQRNMAVHAHRTAHPDNLMVELYTTHRGRSAGIAKEISSDDLSKIGSEIAAVHKAFYEELLECGFWDVELSLPARFTAKKAVP